MATIQQALWNPHADPRGRIVLPGPIPVPGAFDGHLQEVHHAS